MPVVKVARASNDGWARNELYHKQKLIMSSVVIYVCQVLKFACFCCVRIIYVLPMSHIHICCSISISFAYLLPYPRPSLTSAFQFSQFTSRSANSQKVQVNGIKIWRWYQHQVVVANQPRSFGKRPPKSMRKSHAVRNGRPAGTISSRTTKITFYAYTLLTQIQIF